MCARAWRFLQFSLPAQHHFPSKGARRNDHLHKGGAAEERSGGAFIVSLSLRSHIGVVAATIQYLIRGRRRRERKRVRTQRSREYTKLDDDDLGWVRRGDEREQRPSVTG